MEKELLPCPQNLGDAKVLIFPNECQKLLVMDASALDPNLSQIKDLNSQLSNASPTKECTDSCLFADISAAPKDCGSQPHTLVNLVSFCFPAGVRSLCATNPGTAISLH